MLLIILAYNGYQYFANIKVHLYGKLNLMNGSTQQYYKVDAWKYGQIKYDCKRNDNTYLY